MQQEAYRQLKALRIFEKLNAFGPVLTGTIPIEIDLPDSDLDIICQCEIHEEFSETLFNHYSNEKDFEIETKQVNNIPTTIARFPTESFKIEIFGQNIPAKKQHAYRHMIIEHQILEKMGEAFKLKIIELKRQGMKTEPAFAKLLGLHGDPYKELLIIDIKKILNTQGIAKRSIMPINKKLKQI